MYEVHIYIAIDSTSPKVTKKQYGYVLACKVSRKDKKKCEITREGFGETTGTYHYTTLVAIIEALGRLNQSCEVHLHTENEFVLNMLEHNLDKWAAGEFKTAKGRPLINQEEWRALWQLAQKQLILTVPGKSEYTGWLLSEMEKKEEK